MNFVVSSILMFLVQMAGAQNIEVMEIVPRGLKSVPLDEKRIKFISDRLYLDKTADYLDCEVHVAELKKDLHFSTGIRTVEMLEITFISRRYRSDHHVAFFPLGSPLTIQNKNSNFAGLVEEIKLESEDIYNTQFIFQHDGKGRITWMNYISDVGTFPCGIKKS